MQVAHKKLMHCFYTKAKTGFLFSPCVCFCTTSPVLIVLNNIRLYCSGLNKVSVCADDSQVGLGPGMPSHKAVTVSLAL